MRRLGTCFAVTCLVGLIVGAPLFARADLIGLNYSVSEDGDSVTIDGETFPVTAIPPKLIEGQFAQFTRGLAIEGSADQLISCSEMWSYNAYGGSVSVDGAACVLEHDGMQENAILCSSVFALNAVSYRGHAVPTTRDVVVFATKACGGSEIKIIREFGTPQIAYGLDQRAIFQMRGEDARAQFAQVESCEMGVSLPVGVANGDVSTGAICRAEREGRTVRFAVCKSEMVDHYKERELGDRSMSVDQLATFTMVYCSGG